MMPHELHPDSTSTLIGSGGASDSSLELDSESDDDDDDDNDDDSDLDLSSEGSIPFAGANTELSKLPDPGNGPVQMGEHRKTPAERERIEAHVSQKRMIPRIPVDGNA